VITQKKEIMGFNLTWKDGKVSLPIGDPVYLGPNDFITKILPFQISGGTPMGILNKLQIPNVMMSHVYNKNGTIAVKLWNTGHLSRAISHKVRVLDLCITKQPVFSFDFPDQSTFVCSFMGELDNSVKSLDFWKKRFPDLIDDCRHFASSDFLRKLQICHREVEWKCSFNNIPLSGRGITHNPEGIDEREIDEFLRSLIRRGVVRKLNFGERSLTSPMLLLRKRNGNLRKVMDFRFLNSYSKECHRALKGGIRDVFTKIPATWRYFTVIDLESGFSNLPVCEDLQSLFGFVFKKERYTYVTLPQGWKNSSALFHERMTSAFSSCNCVSYIDDFLVGGQTVFEHDKNLLEVFQVFSELGMQINFDKIQLAQPEVIFLGHDVFPGGYSLKSFVKRQCSNLPIANSTRQIRRILGIFNFCRGVVSRLDFLVEPLITELKNPVSRRCSLQGLRYLCEDIWKKILERAVPLVFVQTCEEKNWNLTVDWSKGGMGYALFLGDPRDKRLISLGSRTNKTVCSSHLGELMALKWALGEIRDLSVGREIVVWTDSASVVALLSQGELEAASDDVREARLIGWILANFPLGSRLCLRHVPGDYNSVADQLSRWSGHKLSQVPEAQAVAQVTIQMDSEMQEIIEKVHADGHYNALTTLDHLIRDGYGWPGMRQHVTSVVRRCHVCQRHGRDAYTDGLAAHRSLVPNDVVYCDFAGPYCLQSGIQRRSILLLVDGFTRLLRAHLVAQTGAASVVSALEQWRREFGPPAAIQTDNARSFTSQQVKKWCRAFGVRHRFSSAYSPHSNGIVERMVGNLKLRIKKALGDKQLSWSSRVLEAQNTINRSVNQVTGFTPDELTFGRCRDGTRVSTSCMLQWRSIASANTVSRQKYADWRFRNRRMRGRQLQVGEKVLWKTPQALRDSRSVFCPIWQGPFVITNRSSRMFFDIQDLNSGKIKTNIHSHSLKRYF